MVDVVVAAIGRLSIKKKISDVGLIALGLSVLGLSVPGLIVPGLSVLGIKCPGTKCPRDYPSLGLSVSWD